MPLLAFCTVAFISDFFDYRSQPDFLRRVKKYYCSFAGLGIFLVADVSTFTKYLIVYQLELYLMIVRFVNASDWPFGPTSHLHDRFWLLSH